MLRLALVVLTFMFISACSTAAHRGASADLYSQQEPSAYTQESAEVLGAITEHRYLVKTASVELEVEKLDVVAERIQQLAKQTDGYLDQSNRADKYRMTLQIKVPVSHFDRFIKDVEQTGQLESKSVQVRDVTESVVDTSARLNSLKQLRDRMRALLSKAQDLSEILQVEKEITRLQSDIERIEGRLAALKKQAAMSDVYIELQEKRVLGPVAYVGVGIYWLLKKLFILD